MPASVAEANTTEPTERSMPPTSTTSAIASPSTSTEADWRMMLTALPGVPKTGEVATNSDASRTTPRPAWRSATAAAQGGRAAAGAGGRGRGGHAAAAPWTSRLSRSSSSVGRLRSRPRSRRRARPGCGRPAPAPRGGRTRPARSPCRRAPAHRAGGRCRRGRRHRRRASARSARRRRRRRGPSAPAAPSAGCRRRACASALRVEAATTPKSRHARATAVAPSAAVDDAERPARGRRARRRRCFRAAGRLGRMPSCLRSSVSRQMPAATASCGLRRPAPLPSSDDDAALGAEVAADEACDLVLPGAEQAGQRQHFAAPDDEGRRRGRGCRSARPRDRPATAAPASGRWRS